MWFKSKLQHPDPAMRRQYVEELEPDNPLLTEAAQTDPHPEVRSAALAIIRDIQVLDRLGRDDADEQVRRQATARLQSLISGHADGSPPLDNRIAFATASGDERLVRFLARSGREPELRKLAVAQLLSQPDNAQVLDLLCDIAASDPVTEIREAAAGPIRDDQRLRRLLEQTHGRDKSIHKLVRERLEAIQAQSDAAEGLEKTAAEIERLAAGQFSEDGKIERARLALLTEDWNRHAAIATTVDAGLLQRFESARERIGSNLDGIAELQKSRDCLMTALRAHLDDQPAETVSELIRRWHDLGDPGSVQQNEFDRLVRQVTEHDSRRERDEHRLRVKQDILAAFDAAHEAEVFGPKDLTRLEARWEVAKDPEDDAAVRTLQEGFLSRREKLRARLARQEKRMAEEIAKATTLLEKYEACLASGNLREAVSAHDKTVSALAKLDLPEKRRKKLEQRLRAGEPRMAELKQWRHWGTERKREELCEKAEGLATAGMKIPDVAKAVREYRNEWKLLDKSDGPSGKKLWHRFDKACEAAYAPCQAFFDEQKAQRRNNMQVRVAICEELEALAAGTDWDAPPWRELADALRAIQQKWHKAGSVERRERGKIQSRYDAANGAIEEHLVGMRDREIERRETLIARVEALSDTTDTRRAMDVARDAQKEWKPLVQAGRRQEQQLWKRFRAACDAVFERRDEQTAEAEKERKQNLGEKLAVQGQIDEMIVTLKRQLEAGEADADAVRETRTKVRQLANGWRRIGPVPRNRQAAADKQFRGSCQEAEKLCGSLEKLIAGRAVQLLRETAALCESQELKAATDGNVDAAAVEEAWSRLDAIDDDRALRQRLQRLRAAVSGDTGALEKIRGALADNLDTRRRLCLEMEIAAGIESPDDCREERMQYRVAQLSASMSGHSKPLVPSELERRWYLSGAVPADAGPGLETRFQRALTALTAASPSNGPEKSSINK